MRKLQAVFVVFAIFFAVCLKQALSWEEVEGVERKSVERSRAFKNDISRQSDDINISSSSHIDPERNNLETEAIKTTVTFDPGLKTGLHNIDVKDAFQESELSKDKDDASSRGSHSFFYKGWLPKTVNEVDQSSVTGSAVFSSNNNKEVNRRKTEGSRIARGSKLVSNQKRTGCQNCFGISIRSIRCWFSCIFLKRCQCKHESPCASPTTSPPPPPSPSPSPVAPPLPSPYSPPPAPIPHPLQTPPPPSPSSLSATPPPSPSSPSETPPPPPPISPPPSPSPQPIPLSPHPPLSPPPPSPSPPSPPSPIPPPPPSPFPLFKSQRSPPLSEPSASKSTTKSKKPASSSSTAKPLYKRAKWEIPPCPADLSALKATSTEVLLRRVENAIMNDRYKALRTFLCAGIDVNMTEPKFGATMLYLAAQQDAPISISLLCALGSNIEAENNYGRTPLFIAVRENATEALQALLKAGADDEAHNLGGVTPLMTSTKNDYALVTQILLDNGAFINARDKSDKETALFYAVQYCSTKSGKILIDSGAEVNITDRRKQSSLQYAIQDHCPNLVEALLKAEADTKILDRAKNTPLHLAAIIGSVESTKLLLEFGADRSAHNGENKTPAEVVCLEMDCSEEVKSELLELPKEDN